MAITRSTPSAMTGAFKSSGVLKVTVTVPAGAVCVVFTTAEHCIHNITLPDSSTSSIPATLVVSDTGGRTWTLRDRASLLDAGAGFTSAVWAHDWYNSTGASVTTTVSVDPSGIEWNPMVSVGAQVLTGVKDPSTYTPASVSTYAHRAPSVPFVPTSIGSQLVGCIAMALQGSDDTSALVATSGSTIDSSMQWSSSTLRSAMVARSATETTKADAITFGAASPNQASAHYSLVAIEYLASGATGGVNTLPVRGSARNTIAWIGDSLTYQDGNGQAAITSALTKVGWPTNGTWVYGVSGKQIAKPEIGSGLATMNNIDTYLSTHGNTQPDLWVIALVTNDLGISLSTVQADIQTVLDKLGSNARVAWVLAGLSAAARQDVLDANNLLKTMLASRPNSYVIDWWEYLVEADTPGTWFTDGTHMTTEGYAAKNAYIANQTLEAMYQIGGASTGDTTAPAAPVITSANSTSSTTPTITGTAEANSTITLTVNSKTYTATTTSGGAWSIAVTTALTAGQTYPVSVTAKDAAGNTSTAATQSLTITSGSAGGTGGAIVRSTPVAIEEGYKSSSPYKLTVTVPAGAVCAVISSSENCFDSTSPSTYAPITISDTGNHTWIERGHKYAVDTYLFAATWIHDWYNNTGASVTFTVSVDFNALAYNPMVSVVAQVLTNVANPSTYTPQVVSAAGSITPQVSMKPTMVGSQIIAGVTRKQESGETITALTPLSGTVIDSSPAAMIVAPTMLGGAIARQQPETSTANTITIGASAPSGVYYSIVAVEYQPVGAVATETNFRVRANGAWQMTNSLTRLSPAWAPIVHYGITDTPITPPSDATAPGTPTLSVNTSSSTQLVVTYSATDNVGVSGYRVRIDGGAWITTTATSYTFTGLTAGSTHTIDVQASDAAGNTSASGTWTGTTAGQAITTPDGRAYTAAVLTDAPSVYYAMQEQSGTTATDWSDNTRNGTYVGTPKVDWTGNRYKFPAVALGRCVLTENITSNTQVIQLPPSSIDVTSGVSVEMWVRVTSVGWNSHLFSFSNAAGGDDIELKITTSNLFLGVGGTEVTAPAISFDVWHHVVATVTPARVGTVYIDGAQVATGTVGALTQQARPSMYFGRAIGNSNYINGMWTQCAVYNKVLSPSRVQAHYTTGQSDQDPVWHGGNEWYDPAYFNQWTGGAWLNNPSHIFFADWQPSYDGLNSLTAGKPYYDVGINQHYWSTLDGAAYPLTVAQYAQQAVNIDMRMIPAWEKIDSAYNGQDAIGFAGPDEADMHNPTDPNDYGNIDTLRTALAKTKTTGKIGYENYGTLVTTGQGSTAVPPETYANLDGLNLWSADLYFYSVGEQTYGDLATYWGLKREECRRACNYGTLIERQRGMLTAPKPIWGIVDLAHPNNRNDAGGPNPDQVEGAVWGSIIGGARGIEWFHHSFTANPGPSAWSAVANYAVSSNVTYNGTLYYAALKPAVGQAPSDNSYTWVRYSTNSGAGIDIAEARHPDLLARIKKIRADVDAVAAAIYSPSTPHLCHKNVYSTYRPNARDGKKYIIAIPDLGAPNGGTFNMYLPKGQNPTSIEVVGEGRTITPSGGNFTDTFAAEYTHHVYRW